MTTRPRGNKRQVAPADQCVIFPEAVYRWPAGVSAFTGIGASKLRRLKEQHSVSTLDVGEKKFVRGADVIAMIVAVASQDGNGHSTEQP